MDADSIDNIWLIKCDITMIPLRFGTDEREMGLTVYEGKRSTRYRKVVTRYVSDP